MEIKQTVISDHSTVLYVYLSLGGVDFDFSHRLAVSWKSDRNSVRAAVRRGWLVIKGEGQEWVERYWQLIFASFQFTVSLFIVLNLTHLRSFILQEHIFVFACRN